MRAIHHKDVAGVGILAKVAGNTGDCMYAKSVGV